MLLESGVEITTNGAGRSFSRIAPVRVDRTGSLRRMPNGGIRRVQPIGATRRKWEVDLQIEFRRNATVTAKDFTYWQERNENCVFANEFSRNPDEVYPASFHGLGDGESVPDVVETARASGSRFGLGSGRLRKTTLKITFKTRAFLKGGARFLFKERTTFIEGTRFLSRKVVVNCAILRNF